MAALSFEMILSSRIKVPSKSVTYNVFILISIKAVASVPQYVRDNDLSASYASILAWKIEKSHNRVVGLSHPMNNNLDLSTFLTNFRKTLQYIPTEYIIEEKQLLHTEAIQLLFFSLQP